MTTHHLQESRIILILLLCFFSANIIKSQVTYKDIIPDKTINSYINAWGNCTKEEQFELDITGDNIDNFTFSATCSEYPYSTITIKSQHYTFDKFFGDEYVDTLNFGDPINNDLNWTTGERIILRKKGFPLTYYGIWELGKEKFIGLNIINQDNSYFGWIRLVVTNGVETAIIKDFAISTISGQPIFAGEGLLNFALDIELNDIGDEKNGSDLLVDFDPAYDDQNILEYRIMVVRSDQAASFNVDSANSVPEEQYYAVLSSGNHQSINLTPNTLSTDGELITNMIEYTVFILSVYAEPDQNVLSYPSQIMLQTQTDPVTQLFCVDIGNNNDGRDVHVSFNKIDNEDKVSEYRVMVVPEEQTGGFNIEMANQVAPGNYECILPSGLNHAFYFHEHTTDINNEILIDDKKYYTFVLSIADGILTDKNALTSPPNLFILSTPDYLYAGQINKPGIHYVDIDPDTLIYALYNEPGNVTYYLDLDGNGTNDYRFFVFCGGSMGYWQQYSEIIGLHWPAGNKIIATQYNAIFKKNYGDPLTFANERDVGYLSSYYYDDMSGTHVAGYWRGSCYNKYAGLIMHRENDTIIAWIKLDVLDYSNVWIKEYAWMIYTSKTIADFDYTWDEMTMHFINQSINADYYIWDFGDGDTSDVQNPIHTYQNEGDYIVTLIASGPFGSDTASEMIHVCEMATANFTYDQDNWGNTSFNNHSQNALGYHWDFGDGSFSIVENPVYTYSEDGEYVVTLIAQRGYCSDTTSTQVDVCIFPTADFVCSQDGNTIHFSSMCTKTDSVFWNFDDGYASSLENPIHTYDLENEYIVTLIAFNECGSDTIYETIQVSAIKKFDGNEYIKVFPNPAKDIIYIQFTNLNEQKITLEIFNLNGQKILQRDQRYIDNDQIIDINLSSQPEGIYFLKIQLEDRIYTHKLVLIRHE